MGTPPYTLPLSYRFVEGGGYDNMYDAFVIVDAKGREFAALDTVSADNRAGEEFAAKLIVEAVNNLDPARIDALLREYEAKK